LLNTPIVIWRDGAAVRAFKDACPHRLVPLSEGRIAPNGCLECPYHGTDTTRLFVY
jgi:phenylpropionate dioxygenase-like ring-hydroxylating dioxygenase large terminal subunit